MRWQVIDPARSAVPASVCRLGTAGQVFGSPATWPHARSSALRPRLATGVPLSVHRLYGDAADFGQPLLRLHGTVSRRGDDAKVLCQSSRPPVDAGSNADGVSPRCPCCCRRSPWTDCPGRGRYEGRLFLAFPTAASAPCVGLAGVYSQATGIEHRSIGHYVRLGLEENHCRTSPGSSVSRSAGYR
jgi:hypothetical protein